MRRRIARHVERGTSERVLACLIGAPAAASGGTAGGQGHDPRDAEVDLSNVIQFRPLSDPGPLPAT